MADDEADLLIVGAGDLGQRIALLWRELHPQARVVAETRTTRLHASLRQLGAEPRLVAAEEYGGPPQAPPAGQTTAKQVVFCVPPTKCADYARLIARARGRTARGGRFVLTGSTGVHGNAGDIDETTGAADTDRARRLLAGEVAALGLGEGEKDTDATAVRAFVLRLTGLYTGSHGPQNLFLARGHGDGTAPAAVWPSHADREFNMLHYDDAAGAVVAALRLPDAAFDALAPPPQLRQPELARARGGVVCLVAVRNMISARQFVDAAMRLPQCAQCVRPEFRPREGEAPPTRGRVYDSRWSREALRWAPRWEGFKEFVDDGGMSKELKVPEC